MVLCVDTGQSQPPHWLLSWCCRCFSPPPRVVKPSAQSERPEVGTAGESRLGEVWPRRKARDGCPQRGRYALLSRRQAIGAAPGCNWDSCGVAHAAQPYFPYLRDVLHGWCSTSLSDPEDATLCGLHLPGTVLAFRSRLTQRSTLSVASGIIRSSLMIAEYYYSSIVTLDSIATSPQKLASICEVVRVRVRAHERVRAVATSQFPPDPPVRGIKSRSHNSLVLPVRQQYIYNRLPATQKTA